MADKRYLLQFKAATGFKVVLEFGGEDILNQNIKRVKEADLTWERLSDFNLNLTNTHALGNVLYTEYIHLFQIAGMILLVAMIGAITLTFHKRENIKRQNYFSQIQRDKISGVSLVDVESEKGIKLDD